MIPTEKQEQVMFINYLKLKNIAFFHVPNSTYTKSWNQKRQNVMLGVQAGVPDLFVCLPGLLVAIEMKRVKGGVVSLHQKKWLGILNDSGVVCTVAKGAEEAIEFIEGLQE